MTSCVACVVEATTGGSHALFFLSLVVLYSLGCGARDAGDVVEPEPPSLKLPPAPSRGFQLVLPVVEDIPPGTSLELCTSPDKFVEQDTEVAELVGAQIGGGHHINVYVTNKLKTSGTSRICEDSDMIDLTYGAAAVGDGSFGLSKPPSGLAFFMPASTQIVINQHFLNASPRSMRGQSVLNVYYTDREKSYTRSSALSFADTMIMVPPGESSADFGCTVQEDMSVWLFFPHMHEWGKHVLIEHTGQSGATRLFDTDWSKDYVFYPPQLESGPSSDALLFRQGDTLRIRCTWNHTTGKTLSFGQEMCVASGQFADHNRAGNRVCLGGHWSHF